MKPVSRKSILTDNAVKAAQDHAREEYLKGGDKPRESIGVISDGIYIPLKNVHPNPHESAKPSRKVWADLSINKKFDCLVHSHPDGPFYPSHNDMIGQMNLMKPHGVLACYKGEACTPISLWGDSLEIPPLEGRFFQHGITDCYDAVRDFYRINDIVHLPQVARSWEWWRNGMDLYADYFEKTGFKPIPAAEALPNDGVLFKMPTRKKSDGRYHVGETYNHAAIYLGNDTIYHHPSSGDGYSATNISGKAALSSRMKYDPLFLRPASK